MILVTGAAGLSGSIIARELARQGVRARLLVRDGGKAAFLKDIPGMEIVEGDMRRRETLAAALYGVERALMISSSSPDMAETQCSFIDACRAAEVRHVIKFSGAEPDFDPQAFLFTRLHAEIERYLERSGLAWTHLRPSQFMQVYLREIPTIVKEDAFYLPFADIQLAPIDLIDVAQVATTLLRDGGHIGARYDMTGPEALSMDNIAAHLSAAAGRPIRYVPITIEQHRERLLTCGVPGYLVDALGDQTRERLRRKTSRTCLGAHEAFGIEPTRFAAFALRCAEMLRRAA
jgi:uncharacterized protein YbjT (DUF2867 family)